MSRGLGQLQLWILQDLRRIELLEPLFGWRDMDAMFGRVPGSPRWVHVSKLLMKSIDPNDRAEWASVRRSVRSLHNRGLVEFKMMNLPISQQDPLYMRDHEVVRKVMVVRLTPAGRAHMEALDDEGAPGRID
ncbi:hypothetical protein ACQP0C_41805 (plasmid) [Nocardia sp. CA-129566]|uniref:hypothetical protein n=1 Tax=Nocardia sp. CA-129566 TaxID=3239976 RepID=UPI003D987A4F